MRLKHTLGFMSLVAVYAPTAVCVADQKEMFYPKLDCSGSVPRRDTLIVLGDSNAATGTERAGYKLCVGPHGSGTRNTNSSPEFCKIQKVENCSFLVPEARVAPLDLVKQYRTGT